MLPREKAKIRLVAVLVWTLAFSPPVWAALPTPDKMSEAKRLIDARELDSAEKIIVAEMMTAPRDADWITLLAQVRLGQNRTAGGLEIARRCGSNRRHYRARAMLISLAESQAGHMDLAEPPLRTAIRLDPFNASAHYFLGRLLYTDNRFDEAIEESNKAITLAPGFVRAYENLGLCYEGKHDQEEAERWYRKAIDRETTSETKTEWPMLDLATMMIHENRYAEAKPYLTQALDINPHNTDPCYRWEFSWREPEILREHWTSFVQQSKATRRVTNLAAQAPTIKLLDYARSSGTRTRRHRISISSTSSTISINAALQ